ncbi:MAG: ABC transporter ATP-binding protein [Oscillospiraceae bacterium]|nr:ABC transporter ATP-binding protein [Oscillospiraceae bacterium]
MFRLFKYLKNYVLESILGPLFKMTEATFELIVPIVMSKIIETGIKHNDKEYILKMGGVLVLLGVLGLACSLTAQFFAAKASMGFGTALRKDLYHHINKFSHAEIDRIGTSTLITRMTSDINQAQTGVNMFLRLFLRSPFIVIGAIIAALLINVKLTLIFLVASPVIALIIYLIMTISIPKYTAIAKKTDKVSLLTRENLAGVRVVRAFSRQEEEKQDFKETSESLMKHQIVVGRISALLNPATYVVVNLAILAIMWFGGKTVYAGDLSQGEVIALVNYMSQILLALVALANLIVILTKASASSLRINEIFNTKPELSDENAKEITENNSENAVEFKNVSFKYSSDADNAVSGLTFTVKKGQTIGIIGGTGSGKSTLINLIPRFYEVSQGEVLVNGENVKDYTFTNLREKIGIVPQKAVLFKGTIRDNMRWGKADATDEEIYKALDIAQAREFVDSKPDGLDTMIMQNGRNLSGGQRQRLTIARAIVKKCEILILDDSASALDYATDAKLRKAISEQTEGLTVFIVSQRATTIKNADMIIVMDDGEIAGIGTHKELLKNCNEYREICQSQLSREEIERDEK